MSLANIVVEISANATKLRKGLTSSLAATQRFSKSVGNSIKNGIGKGLDAAKKKVKAFAASLGNALKNAAKFATAGFAGAIGGLLAIVTTNSKAAKELLNVSNALGVSVVGLTSWGAAAKKVGLDADKMNDILKDTADKIGDFATTGGGEAADIFERLSLNISEFKNLDAGDALLKIGKSMSNLTNKEQVFLMESLADEASKLIPLFKDNAAAYQSAVAEAVKSGNILTRQQAERASAFSKSLATLKSKISGFGKQITVQLAEPFAKVVEWINRSVESMGGISEVAKKFATSLINGVANAIEGFGSLINYFRDMQSWLISLKVAALEVVESLLWGNAIKNAAKFVGSNFQLGISDDIDAAKKQLQELESSSQNTKKFGDDVKKKAEEIRALIGSGGSDSDIQAAISAYQDSTGAVEKMAGAARTASDALASISSASTGAQGGRKGNFKGLFDPESAIQNNTFNPLGNSGGLSGFKGAKSNGYLGSTPGTVNKVGSIQDYINSSPAGKALQDIRQKGSRLTGGGSATINGQSVGLRPDSFNGKASTAARSAQKTVRVTLDMVTDYGKVSEEVIGTQAFVDAVSKLQNKSTNKSARMAAQ